MVAPACGEEERALARAFTRKRNFRRRNSGGPRDSGARSSRTVAPVPVARATDLAYQRRSGAAGLSDKMTCALVCRDCGIRCPWTEASEPFVGPNPTGATLARPGLRARQRGPSCALERVLPSGQRDVCLVPERLRAAYRRVFGVAGRQQFGLIRPGVGQRTAFLCPRDPLPSQSCDT